MIIPLRYYGDPVLRQKALPIEVVTDEVRRLAFDMVETMDAKRGVGLAANQIGKLLRIFVIRPEIAAEDGEFMLGEPEFYINPSLILPSEELEVCSEGCLSIPKLHLDIERPKEIHIRAMNLEGQWFEADVGGFKARELMHENDHLNGVLFVDRYKGSRLEVDDFLRQCKKKYSS
jgi:peptide deformylase